MFGKETNIQVGVREILLYHLVHAREELIIGRVLGNLCQWFQRLGGEPLHQPAAHQQHIADACFQVLYGERLLDIGVGPHVHALHLGVVVGLRREHHKGDMAGKRVAAYMAAELGTIHPRHHPVADDDAHLLFREYVERLQSVARRHHLVFVAEIVGEEFHHVIGVVYDEHRGQCLAGDALG